MIEFLKVTCIAFAAYLAGTGAARFVLWAADKGVVRWRWRLEKKARENRAAARSWTQRGFLNWGAMSDSHGNALTLRQSSSDLDCVWLFCKPPEPRRPPKCAECGFAPEPSPHLTRDQARALAAFLTDFADGDDYDF